MTAARLRFPLRSRILVVIGVVLLATVGLYAWFATRLVTKDKIADAYQSNARTTGAVAEQTELYLRLLREQLLAAGRRAVEEREAARDPSAALMAALEGAPEIVAVTVSLVSDEGTEPIAARWLPARLDDSALSSEDIVASVANVPLRAVHVAERPIAVENVSVPPDAALLRVSVLLPRAGAAANVSVAAIVKPTALLDVLRAGSRYHAYLIDETGTALIHEDAAVVIGRRDMRERGIVERALSSRFDDGVQEVAAPSGGGIIGGFARVDGSGVWAITEIDRADVLQAAAALQRRSLLFAGASLSLALIASVLLSRRLTRSLARLHEASRAVGRGQLDVTVDVVGDDEISDLAEAFRGMGKALRATQLQLVRSEKLAAFGQLGAGIAHEVKNPLTNIIGFAQLARRKRQDPEKLAEYLEQVETAARRCKDIVESFLRFARASPNELVPLDVAAEVESGLKLVRHQLELHQVVLRTELDAGLPPVLASSGQLHQVLLNLTLNAQQAMPEGGVVTVRTRAEAGGVVIDVQDSGPGVPAELRDRIFEPFFTTKSERGGTGLGLSVCFGIVQDHRGRIVVDDAPGGGARVEIWLPAISHGGEA